MLILGNRRFDPTVVVKEEHKCDDCDGRGLVPYVIPAHIVEEEDYRGKCWRRVPEQVKTKMCWSCVGNGVDRTKL